MKQCIVVGGGPAGMMAAARAAERGWSVTLLERNEKLGKKLYITGKGRCNLTNTADSEQFFQHILRNPRFMMSAWQRFDNRALMTLVESLGVPLKEERGGRIFPQTEKASDIIRAFDGLLHRRGVEVRLGVRVTELMVQDGQVKGVRDTNGQAYPAQRVILATGGLSYPLTGSTGDGYEIAKANGLAVTELHPSLVSLHCADPWADLAGLSLKNVTLSANIGKKHLWKSEVGEMQFTHKGVSGPLVLSLSALATTFPFEAHIDLKPGLDHETLDTRLLRDLEGNIRKILVNAFVGLLPNALLPKVLEQAQLSPAMPAHQLDRTGRQRLVETLKGLTLQITGSGGYEEAVVTRGGINVKQIDPRDMSVKAIDGLAIAGELLDLDGTTGGYNLTIAFVTGYAAGDVDI